MAKPAYVYPTIIDPKQETMMKDFHRRKMALRVMMAKELHRRGLPLDEIAKTCRPSDEEVRDFQRECNNYLPQDDYIEVEPITIQVPKPKRSPRVSKYAYFLIALTAMFWFTIFVLVI